MKLSDNTMSVLKNFADINTGVFLKKGKTQRTISKMKTVLAEAMIEEELPSDVGIYELNQLLSVLSMHKEKPELNFDGKNVVVLGNAGRSKTKIRACEKEMIITPPEKNLTVDSPEVTLSFTSEDFTWVMKAASVLGSPNIRIESDGKKVMFTALDLQNNAAHTESLEIADGVGDNYAFNFKTENFKMVPGGYDVVISTKGVANFKHKTFKLQYWIATEAGSTFKGK